MAATQALPGPLTCHEWLPRGALRGVFGATCGGYGTVRCGSMAAPASPMDAQVLIIVPVAVGAQMPGSAAVSIDWPPTGRQLAVSGMPKSKLGQVSARDKKAKPKVPLPWSTPHLPSLSL